MTPQGPKQAEPFKMKTALNLNQSGSVYEEEFWLMIEADYLCETANLL